MHLLNLRPDQHLEDKVNERLKSIFHRGLHANEPRVDYATLITVIVGHEERKFVVHQSALCRNSDYFKAACSRDWPEGREGIIKLADIESDTFEAYISSVYAKDLDTSAMREVPGLTVPPSNLVLTKLHVLADYFGNQRMCNLVVDRIIQKVDDVPEPIDIQELLQLWCCLPETSRIRSLFLNIATAQATFEWLSAPEAEHIPQEFTLSIARSRFPGGEIACPAWDHRCMYHTHPAGKSLCLPFVR